MNDLPDCQPFGNSSGIRVVKNGTRKRLKNPWRDGQFFLDLWAARHAAGHAEKAGTSVTSPSHPTPHLPTKFQRFLKHYQEPLAGKLKRTPAEWRDVSPWLRTTYFHHAAHNLGTVHAFTLRLRHDVEEKARAQFSAASWLQKRLVNALSAALGRPVDFWFVLENGRTGRDLHLHGELVVGIEQVETARKALRLAAGEWTTTRQHQAHTRLNPDEAWVGYVMKAAPYTNAKSPARHQRQFDGENHAATHGIRSRAQVLYTADRREACGE